MLTFLGLAMRFSVLSSYRDMENNALKERLMQIKNTINNELDGLNSTLADWTGWDDTKDYALGTYPEYIQDNMMDASFTNLSINFIWIGDTEGRELFAKMVDLTKGEEIPFPGELRHYIRNHPQLTHFTTVKEKVKTFFATQEDLGMIAAQPVRDSNDNGPVSGIFIMGKYMDSNWVKKISTISTQPFIVYKFDGSNLPLPVQKACKDYKDGLTDPVLITSKHSISGFTFLSGLDGTPAVVLEVPQPRTLFEAAWRSLGYFFGVTTAIAILLIVVMVILIDRLVLLRLINLNNFLNTISVNGDITQRLTVTGKDEISDLMYTLNGMMDTIEQSDRALQKAHDQLELKVQERTAELADIINEKNILIKEVHHRVKNNLQIILSLLNMQSRKVNDEQTLSLLHDSQSRIESMALVHEMLYQSDTLEKINFKNYLESLASNLFQLFWRGENPVTFSLECGTIELEIETAIPCGLLVSELITNSLKHAFPVGSGVLHIQFFLESGNYILIVEDNGIGFPPHFDRDNSSSLGMQLVSSLTRQLDGELVISNTDGAHIEVTFPAGSNKT